MEKGFSGGSLYPKVWLLFNFQSHDSNRYVDTTPESCF